MAEWLDFPFRIDGRGRSAGTTEDDHLRDLIYQVLFTAPGERVNRPDFGCGVRQLVFMPNAQVLAAATQLLIHGALQRWLQPVIDVVAVEVDPAEERLEITITYTKRSDGTTRMDRFAPAGP